ncbi:MAG: DUF4430 domain-containing protein [Firmicutes bacterium]|jgi:hypothetical protein|nr:DUF4430 domain-containing protein [Bacillota bacterium]NLL89205.1 DUF4430 domain-containing protein [Bacillota bacterium]HKM16766.1 DUF4430 domain-containing protein [Limnochordia bacterium]
MSRRLQVYILFALTLVVVLGVAASIWLREPAGDDGLAEAGDTVDVKVILSENNGQNPLAYYFKVPKDNQYTLLELMERKFLVEHDNDFITSIQGKKASNTDQTAWMYDINGEMALVGAAQYRIKDGDVYHWDLRPWQ